MCVQIEQSGNEKANENWTTKVNRFEFIMLTVCVYYCHRHRLHRNRRRRRRRIRIRIHRLFVRFYVAVTS